MKGINFYKETDLSRSIITLLKKEKITRVRGYIKKMFKWIQKEDEYCNKQKNEW